MQHSHISSPSTCHGFVRTLCVLILAITVPCGPAALASSRPSIRWICSTESQRWHDRAVEPAASGAPASKDVLVLDSQRKFQIIDGFGGCFNELGWEALVSLPAEKRESALEALFAPDGANFTLCRAPIGANDFSLGWYSLDETPGDYAMKAFSIARTRECLIPFIKAAMKYQPRLGIWAVPWCPPSWMTTNGRYRQGHMKQDPQTLAAYALYFSKFVRAWRAEGINVYAIHPQNEPTFADNIYPQCAWSGPELNRFIRDYLLPQFARDHVTIEVWLGTIVSDNLADYTDPVLGDPKTAGGITGVGYQYRGEKTLLATHEKYPSKKLAQTETVCYDGENSWEQAMQTFGHLIDDTAHFANSYFYWNMVLDESGLSRWNWRQNSLLTVNRSTETVIYNPEFYAMKHFSATVQPGAQRIEVRGGPFSQVVAFQNPDGSEVLMIENGTRGVVSTVLDTGATPVRLAVPALSMNTIVIK